MHFVRLNHCFSFFVLLIRGGGECSVLWCAWNLQLVPCHRISHQLYQKKGNFKLFKIDHFKFYSKSLPSSKTLKKQNLLHNNVISDTRSLFQYFRAPTTIYQPLRSTSPLEKFQFSTPIPCPHTQPRISRSPGSPPKSSRVLHNSQPCQFR